MVPAIAMLKPADLKEGWASRLLSASDTPAAAEDAGESQGFSEVTDDFDALFGDEMPDSVSEPPMESDDSLFREAIGDSLTDDFPVDPSGDTAFSQQPHATTATIVSSAVESDFAPLMNQLQRLGATKTLWFTPGNQMVGFVAFFKEGNSTTSYRFESIARSQADALQDVIQQVRAWHRDAHR